MTGLSLTPDVCELSKLFLLSTSDKI